MTFRWWDRWGPVAGIVSTVFFVVGIAITPNEDTNKSDARIVAFFAKHSNQVNSVVSFFVFFAAVFFFVLFLAALRGRLATAEGAPGRLTALAYGAGVAAAAQFIVSFALFAAPGASELDTSNFKLDPNTYRIVNNTGYFVFIGAVMTASLLLLATAALALRTGVVARWFAWISVLAGVILLAAFIFLPVFVLWGWTLVASILLLLRPAAARVPAP
jgi:magnesium-transporting ATPase (P-type)